jgi:hypothetical protein
MARHHGKRQSYQPSTSHLPEARIRRHLEAINLENVTAYRVWCRQQGFGDSLRKTEAQLQRERERAHRLALCEIDSSDRERHLSQIGCREGVQYAEWCERHHFRFGGRKSRHQYTHEARVWRAESAEAALQAANRRVLGPEALVEAIYAGRKPPEIPASDICWRIQHTFDLAAKHSGAREALLPLVKRVYVGSRLYQQALQVGPQMPWPGMALPQALFQLALRRRQWVRQPETWKPQGRSARRQFGSLVRHLLATYAVPAFLDAAWFEGDNSLADAHRHWFVEIGTGASVRMLDLPLLLTSKARRHFLRAPADVEITAALRWGQVLGCGGSAGLARAVIGSRLRDPMADEAFWTTVIRWFSNQPSLQAHQVAPIVDYLYHRKYVADCVVAADGQLLQGGPPEPNLEMKGRTLAALWRRVEAWHVELARAASVRPCEWARSGIETIRVYTQEAGRVPVALHWTLEELLHTRELQAEGAAMHNCVASYAEECMTGASSIWSLRVRRDHEPTGKRVMTVEVDTAKRAIVQARGQFNRLPGAGKSDTLLQLAPEILRLWAQQQNLTISTFAW